MYSTLSLSTQGWVEFKMLNESNKIADLSHVAESVLRFKLLKSPKYDIEEVSMLDDQIVQFIKRKETQLQKEVNSFREALKTKYYAEISNFVRSMLNSAPVSTQLNADAELMFDSCRNVSDPHAKL
ncbi:hypothetical protein P9112_010575 [Eukaryota sp. TZLM1-RC]